jgi:hypothetical protein
LVKSEEKILESGKVEIRRWPAVFKLKPSSIKKKRIGKHLVWVAEEIERPVNYSSILSLLKSCLSYPN